MYKKCCIVVFSLYLLAFFYSLASQARHSVDDVSDQPEIFISRRGEPGNNGLISRWRMTDRNSGQRVSGYWSGQRLFSFAPVIAGISECARGDRQEE